MNQNEMTLSLSWNNLRKANSDFQVNWKSVNKVCQTHTIYLCPDLPFYFTFQRGRYLCHLLQFSFLKSVRFTEISIKTPGTSCLLCIFKETPTTDTQIETPMERTSFQQQTLFIPVHITGCALWHTTYISYRFLSLLQTLNTYIFLCFCRSLSNTS